MAATTTDPMRSGEFQFQENGLCSSTRPDTQLVTVPDMKLVGVPAGPMYRAAAAWMPMARPTPRTRTRTTSRHWASSPFSGTPYQNAPTTSSSASSSVSVAPTALRQGYRRIISPANTVPATSPPQ